MRFWTEQDVREWFEGLVPEVVEVFLLRFFVLTQTVGSKELSTFVFDL